VVDGPARAPADGATGAPVAHELIAASGIDRIEARLLLAHVLGVARETLVAHPRLPATAEQAGRFRALCRRRERGEPVAYLLGVREFFGRPFGVDGSVLVPRPETETLVQLAIDSLSGHASPRVLELGTGSGCIAVTLALEVPQAEVWASDISAAALERAAANAAALGARVRFVQSDWYSNLAGRFDLIASNPPYIAAADPHLHGLAFEPAIALTDGADGLQCLQEVIGAASQHLTEGGLIAVEHGFEQAGAVRQLMHRAGLAQPRTLTDLAGRPRVSWAIKEAGATGVQSRGT
jgi:release factor glutamine methyltransferase